MIKTFIKRHMPQCIIDNLISHYQAIDFKPPLLIYQMGKVGSSTIQRSLEKTKLPYSIHHVHFLSQSGIGSAEEHYKSLNKNIPRHIFISKILRKRVLRHPGLNWRIITLVREPVRRLISDFFQNVQVYWHYLVNENGTVKKKDALEFLQIMFDEYDESTDYSSTWFDREINSVFNLDVYSYPFDHQNGYSLISAENVKLLILRTEDLDRTFETAVMEFLNLNTPIKMLKGNVGESKDYSEEYKYVMENLSLPISVCARIYSSKYATHFYTEDERKELLWKWSRKEDKVVAP